MIRIERDPAWWSRIAAHPEVRPHLYGLAPHAVGMVALRDEVIPLASENGGYLFARMDACGLLYELHALYTPDGRGREAYIAGLEAWAVLRAQGVQMLFSYETENPASRPPLSCGFRRAGGTTDSELGNLKAWVLTLDAWGQSAAARRMSRCRQLS